MDTIHENRSMGTAAGNTAAPTPSAGVLPTRALISPAEALRLAIEAAAPLPPRRVPIVEALGSIAAEAVAADRDLPPFPRAMMDGYAVRLDSAGRTLAVAGEVAAGEEGRTLVSADACIEVLTGAPCPPGTEAVVQKEHVRRRGDLVELPPRIERGQHIAPPGSECRAGRVVLRPGELVTPLGIAAMASFGMESALVVPRPRVAVVTTGAELVRAGGTPGPAQIRDSNGPMLEALVRAAGLDPPLRLHAGDDLDSIGRALDEVSGLDLVVLAGGVSAGKYDLVPGALATRGACILFHRVTQKPGKPLLLARRERQLLFGLPGNPLACCFCFSRYVVPAVRILEGRPPPATLLGELAGPVRPKGGRTHFVPARASRAPDRPGGWTLRPEPGVSSADVFASVSANAWVEVPPGVEEAAAGTAVRFEWMPGAADELRAESPSSGGDAP